MFIRLRDYLAMSVVPVILEQSLAFLTKDNAGTIAQKVAGASYQLADAMLAARKKKETK
jgi:hypothetical protein